jgi:DNA helicase HerA-like ATPase
MADTKLIGRVLATEKTPTTIDEFHFWTNSDTKLNAFDIVKVVREDGTDTYGVVESISHITDATSFLTNFISADFGNVDTTEPTFRIGMNYAHAKVSFNSRDDYTPVHNDSKVYLASKDEISKALGLDGIKNKLACGFLKMYEGTEDEVPLTVHLDRKFLLGSEGAHLNISGISGLAAKTSYAMFLMKSIQDTYASLSDDEEDSVAFVLFNVKGRDLMAIDRPNDDIDETTLGEYKELELTNTPFKQVKYYVPFSDSKSPKQSTYLSQEDVANYITDGKLKKFKYVYSEDKEGIEMMFANVEDPNQTMEAIVSKIIDEKEVHPQIS